MLAGNSDVPGNDDNDLEELLESALDDFKKVDLSRAEAKDGAESQASAEGQGSGEDRNEARTSGSGVWASSEPAGLGVGLGMPALPAGGRRDKSKAKKSSSGFGKGKVPGGNMSRTGGGAEGATSSRQVAGEERLTATLEKLAQETRQTVDSMEAGDGAGGDGDMAEKLVKELEALGDSEDMQSLMDNMMRQLLSRDVLQEPMKEIGERYPSWLEENRGKISQEDFDRYSRQHRHIVELGQVYESDPDNFEQIVDLMQKMQECGQPPPEIVKELAPGVELGEDGLPILPEGGPGIDGLPPNCSVM